MLGDPPTTHRPEIWRRRSTHHEHHDPEADNGCAEADPPQRTPDIHVKIFINLTCLAQATFMSDRVETILSTMNNVRP
jgi:hypothetical protein